MPLEQADYVLWKLCCEDQLHLDGRTFTQNITILVSVQYNTVLAQCLHYEVST